MKVVGAAVASLLTGAKPDANVTIVSKSKGFIFVEVHVESPSMATVTASWGAWRASYCSFLREMLVASTLNFGDWDNPVLRFQDKSGDGTPLKLCGQYCKFGEAVFTGTDGVTIQSDRGLRVNVIKL